jgi:hypothetical protein
VTYKHTRRLSLHLVEELEVELDERPSLPSQPAAKPVVDTDATVTDHSVRPICKATPRNVIALPVRKKAAG